jgi:hypothetical protein
MTNRRAFIKTLAAIPPALSLPAAFASADPTRLALVIGNSTYQDSPLVNPANDARAMSRLFAHAGFTVASHLDARRDEMIAAIQRFGALAKQPETKLVVFYYAGHGAQLDWRNYLMPVDAVVQKQEDMKSRCVDLNLLLGQLSAMKDKTFVIILDACRNNPFGSDYKPEQKGLSQFDAPVGTLLAYATAPGNVAADGSGANGLYTENLVRELGRRGTRIEDALKRVRLNVRLTSGGEQIPWETTSLEGDVFIFPESAKKLSESEQIKLAEADITEWSRIKSSAKVDDWKNYLLNFPNGRFAEIAQTRLNNLLMDQKPVTSVPADASAGPMIELGNGKPVPQLVQPSKNPNSAGRYPLGRKFSVGDEYGLVLYDAISKVETPKLLTVTAIDPAKGEVVLNQGEYVWDLMGNPLTDPLLRTSNEPRQFFPAELQVGRKWTAGWGASHPRLGPVFFTVNFHTVALETIQVPAGNFETFFTTFDGFDTKGRRFLGKTWVVPGINVCIKQEMWQTNVGSSLSGFVIADGYMLASLRQKAIDTASAVRATGQGRNLVIKNLS